MNATMESKYGTVGCLRDFFSPKKSAKPKNPQENSPIKGFNFLHDAGVFFCPQIRHVFTRGQAPKRAIRILEPPEKSGKFGCNVVLDDGSFGGPDAAI